MQYTIPHYYKEFQCVGKECPDTCCAGWQIVIDEKTLKNYGKRKDSFGSRLHNSIDWKEQVFLQYDRRCAFLNEDNLCDIYKEAGAKALCRTCRNYPRHVEEYEELREISLSLSCPEAARIILGCREKVRFLYGEDPKREETIPDFDWLLFDKLMLARDRILHILQNRETAIAVRMAMVLALGHDFQQRIDKKRIFESEELLKRYKKEGASEWFAKKLREYDEELQEIGKKSRDMLESLFHLEVLRAGWPDYLAKVSGTLGCSGSRTAGDKEQQFQRALKESDFSIWLEQILVYFVYTYFCGAVYDGNAFGKVKLAVMSGLWIIFMTKAYWIEEGKFPDFSSFTEIVWRYSREMEHSDLNLTKTEKILEGELFSLNNVLSVISGSITV